MPVRRLLFPTVLTLSLLAAPAGAAEKLDKDSKKWLEGVAAIILPEEEKFFRDLKAKEDRAEFQKIFWARRDPDLETADNEFKVEYQKAVAEADRRFKAGSAPGSSTDCGRVFILLGEPAEVKKQPREEGAVGPRQPEVWTYRGTQFKGGAIEIGFDSVCALPQGARLSEQLNRLAESRIANPNIDYRPATDGHLVKLVDLLPKPSPSQALLKQPRQEFTLVAQPKLFMRGKGGATYIGGLVRGEASALTALEEAGKKRVVLVIAAQAVEDGGRVAASTPELTTTPELAEDGSFVASYAVTLRPGKYNLAVAALDSGSQKGSVSSIPVEVPDLGRGELAVSELLILSDVKEGVTQDPKDPLSAFYLGTTQLVPRFGNVFSKSESIQLLALVYDGQTNPAVVTMDKYNALEIGITIEEAQKRIGASGIESARSEGTVIYQWKNDDGSNMSATFQNGKLTTKAQAGLEKAGKAAVTTKFTILKDGKAVTSGEDQTSDVPSAAPAVGPVPLSKFHPGQYLARVKVVDNVAGKEIVREASFEVRP